MPHRTPAARNRTSTRKLVSLIGQSDIHFQWKRSSVRARSPQKCGAQKTKSMLTHGGRRTPGRRRQVQDGRPHLDLALKGAGARTPEGVESKEREGGRSPLRVEEVH